MNELITLHKNATTTQETQLASQPSAGSDYKVAAPYGISRDKVRRWRARDSVADGSHAPHRLQTTLKAKQQELVIYLRRKLQLSLDDLLAVVREFIHPDKSRSALDRLPRRRGESRLPEPAKPAPELQTFKDSEPRFVHVDVKYLPQMADEDSRCCAFVAIDQATHWVFMAIAKARTAAPARRFLKALEDKAPFKIRTVLTGNGTEFSDRLFGSRAQELGAEHAFDRLCGTLDIDHRLTRVRRLQTNGLVARFAGRLEQTPQTRRFNSAEDLHATLHRYVWLYNEHLLQKALKHVAPVQALKDWQKSHPNLCVKLISHYPEPNIDGKGKAHHQARSRITSCPITRPLITAGSEATQH